MPLPPYSKKVFWKEYENKTPTFRLTPVDKPDMSPYLIHMTGKKAIASILEGKERPTPAKKKGEGYLKSNIPEYSNDASKAAGGGFDASVVCFTESPTFSIDYFRYRSYPRWEADLRFGIGFHKEKLIKRGIRPVLYIDDPLTKSIVALHHKLHEADGDAADEQLLKVVDALYPLIFPLLEKHANQGFMWEREWRHPHPDGLVFAHTEIAVICCPAVEEPGIRQILGAAENKIKFIRTWEEYDDVTDYLERQQAVWASKRKGERSEATLDIRLKQLDEQIRERKAAAHQLQSYADIINQLAKEAQRAATEQKRLLEEVKALQVDKEELLKEQAKAEGAKPPDEERDAAE